MKKIIKYLRKLPDGSTLTIIYLKLLCISLKTERIIHYDKLLPCIEEEIAMLLDEDATLVKLTLKAFIQANVVEKLDNDALFFIAIKEMIGQESPSTERVRKHREKQKTLHCNTDVTAGNNLKQICNTEIELENREELDINTEIDIDKTGQIVALYQKHCPSYDEVSTPTILHKKVIHEAINKGMSCKD